MAAKEENLILLDVIPCRSEHITVEREGETIVRAPSLVLNIRGCNAFLFPKGMWKEIASCAFGRTRNGCMGTD